MIEHNILLLKLVTNEEIIGKVGYDNGEYKIVSPLSFRQMVVNENQYTKVMQPWMFDQFIREEEPLFTIHEDNVVSHIQSSDVLAIQYIDFVSEMRREARQNYPHPTYH